MDRLASRSTKQDVMPDYRFRAFADLTFAEAALAFFARATRAAGVMLAAAFFPPTAPPA